jgi:hypothetical protein
MEMGAERELTGPVTIIDEFNSFDAALVLACEKRKIKHYTVTVEGPDGVTMDDDPRRTDAPQLCNFVTLHHADASTICPALLISWATPGLVLGSKPRAVGMPLFQTTGGTPRFG